MDVKLYNIVSIVNEGHSDKVMEVARSLGARGGTIIPANGSISSESEKLYGMNVNPEKEIILILVEEVLVDAILKALYDKLGSSSDAMGIFFTLPVTHASENLLSQYKAPNEEK